MSSCQWNQMEIYLPYFKNTMKLFSMWMTDKWTIGSEKPLQLQGGPYGPPCTVRTPIVAALD